LGSGRHAEKRPLERSGDGPGIVDVLLTEVRPRIDPGNDEARPAGEELLEGEVDAVPGSTLDGPDPRLDVVDAERLAQSDG
jgi:hypothetical protein